MPSFIFLAGFFLFFFPQAVQYKQTHLRHTASCPSSLDKPETNPLHRSYGYVFSPFTPISFFLVLFFPYLSFFFSFKPAGVGVTFFDEVCPPAMVRFL